MALPALFNPLCPGALHDWVAQNGKHADRITISRCDSDQITTAILEAINDHQNLWDAVTGLIYRDALTRLL